MAIAVNQSGHAAIDEMDLAHAGPGTLMGRFMREFWQPVGVSDQLPPGRAVPIRVMNEDFTLYRGEATPSPLAREGWDWGERSRGGNDVGADGGSPPSLTLPRQGGGDVHLLAFRCAHRGTQLSTGWVEGDELRCFYHGWKYDGNGQCMEQPAEPEPFCAKIKIKSYPVHEYLGLIFAYLGEGTPPPPPRYPEFEEGVVVTASMAVLPYNFLNNLENAIDPVHVGFVHRRSNFFADSRPAEFGSGGEAPGSATLESGYGQVSCDETEYGLIYRDTFETGAAKISHLEIPNVIHVKVYPLDAESGWRELVAFKVPQDDTSYRNFSLNVAYVQGEAAERYRALLRSPRNTVSPQQIREVGEDILAGKLRLTVEDLGDLASNVNLQDYVAQRGQGIIGDRMHERLGQSDRVIALYRSLCRRELRKLQNGEPLKKWRWPGYLVTTTGAD